MDRCRTWSTNSRRYEVAKRDEHITSTRTSSSRRRWCDRVQETEIGIRVDFFNFPTLVNSIVEKSLGKGRRLQKEISILCSPSWRGNSIPSSNPRSFRRKSDWSIFAGKCVDSQRHLQVHLSRLEMPSTCTPITNSGSIAGGRDAKSERQTVLFTAVDPIALHLHEQKEFHLTKPRIAFYKQIWKVHQDAVYWIDIR